MKQDDSTPVQLRGHPGQLSTVVRLPQGASTDKATSRSSSCSINLPGVDVKWAGIREFDSARPGLSVLRIKLPVSTPPGAYKGTIQVGNSEVPIVVDVEARPRLRVFPRSFKAIVTPGAVLNANFTVLNTGNSVVAIEKEYRFCVFERGGIDRAFFVALASDQATSDRRIDRLVNELSLSHGGRVRLDVESGGGELQPGEARELRIALRLSDRLRPGQTYSGTWKIENTGVSIGLQVTGKSQEEAK
ncbi:MAG: hypothetical protein ND895_21540 [Pyrinomonadaceae bacterium]|nr:hypothetical protein [Pyrinomonadaceae bacterium]